MLAVQVAFVNACKRTVCQVLPEAHVCILTGDVLLEQADMEKLFEWLHLNESHCHGGHKHIEWGFPASSCLVGVQVVRDQM